MADQKPDSNAEDITKAQSIYQELLTKQQSIMLATISEDGSPHVSYTPFAVDADKNFYIFISTLAHHTKNLMRSEQTSLILIADEGDTQQIFARHRLTFSCQIEALDRNSDAWQTAATHYEDRFGSFFQMIRGFKDFNMFRLIPQDGSLVVGFGQAYALSGDTFDELTLRRE